MRKRRERRVNNKYSKNSFMYMIFNSIFSTVYFAFAFNYIISPNYQNPEKLLGIFMPVSYLIYLLVYAAVTSILGSFTARLITRHSKLHSLTAYTQNIMYSFLYAILIYIGFIGQIFENDNIITIFIDLLALKFFVSIIANVLSTKIIGLK